MMFLKLTKAVFILEIMQSVITFLGFISNTVYTTISDNWINVYDLSTFVGTIYWSVISIVAITGFVISLYILVVGHINKKYILGLILSLVGFGSPIIFSFFLIITTTILILAAVFNKVLIINHGDSVFVPVDVE